MYTQSKKKKIKWCKTLNTKCLLPVPTSEGTAHKFHIKASRIILWRALSLDNSHLVGNMLLNEQQPRVEAVNILQQGLLDIRDFYH